MVQLDAIANRAMEYDDWALRQFGYGSAAYRTATNRATRIYRAARLEMETRFRSAVT